MRPQNIILTLKRSEATWVMNSLREKAQAARLRGASVLNCTDKTLAGMASKAAKSEAERADEIRDKINRQVYPEKFRNEGTVR